MFESIHLAWLWLAAQSALLPYILVTLSAYGSFYAWRKLAPKSWLWVEARVPFALELNSGEELAKNILLGLPSVLAGAFFGALSSGLDPKVTVLSAVAGAFAPLLHHTRKALPFDPYRGAVADVQPDIPKSPQLPLFPVLCLCLALVGCSTRGASSVPCDASDHAAQLALTAHGLECRARVKACSDPDPYGLGGSGGSAGSAGGESRDACRERVIAECDAWGETRCAEGGSK